MIIDIELQNVRSFRDKVMFSMEATASSCKPENFVIVDDRNNFLKVGVIYGANASGKTNLILTLHQLRDVLRGKYNWDSSGGLPTLYTPFMLDKEFQSLPSSIRIRFWLDHHIYTYFLKFDKNELKEEYLTVHLEGEDQIVFERIINKRKEHFISLGKVCDMNTPIPPIQKTTFILNQYLSLQSSQISPAANYLANIQIANGYNSRMLDLLWEDAQNWLKENKKHIEKLKTFLSFVDIGIENFKIPPKENNELKFVKFTHPLYKIDEKIGEVDFSFGIESLGTRFLFVLGAKILETLEKGVPMLVDEMDAAFHSYITMLIINMFREPRINKKNAQLILTTHDISLMDEKTLRLDQIWLTQKDNRGKSEIYSLVDFEGVTENTPLSNWYLANRFGGVPKIESLINLFVDEKE